MHFQRRRKAFEGGTEGGVGFDGAAGRLVELRERKRREQLIAASALPLGDGDGGSEGFLREDGIGGIALMQELTARPVELAFVRAVAHAIASRQRFLENLERPLRIAGAHLGLGKRDLDEAVVDHDVLPAQAFGAVAHGLEPIGEGAAVDRRPADKESGERRRQETERRRHPFEAR